MALAHSDTLRLYVNTGGATPVYTVLNCEMDSDLAMALSTIETTCKDSAGFEEYVADKFSASINFSGNANTDTGLDTILDDILARNETLVEYKTFNLDKWSGNGHITSLSISAANKDVVKFSGTWQLTGTLTKAVA